MKADQMVINGLPSKGTQLFTNDYSFEHLSFFRT
jgi:hypothetical protein